MVKNEKLLPKKGNRSKWKWNPDKLLRSLCGLVAYSCIKHLKCESYHRDLQMYLLNIPPFNDTIKSSDEQKTNENLQINFPMELKMLLFGVAWDDDMPKLPLTSLVRSIFIQKYPYISLFHPVLKSFFNRADSCLSFSCICVRSFLTFCNIFFAHTKSVVKEFSS